MQLNLFGLNLLRALDVLLREKSVARAADRLCVTQQAMSGTLKRLREHFGDELLTRVGQRLELTPQGEALAAPVREVMLQIGRALDVTPAFDPATASRTFRVAMTDYSAAILLPAVMKRMLAAAPGLGCEIVSLDSRAFARLDTGELDLLIVGRSWRGEAAGDTETVRFQHLYQDDFVCVIDPSVNAGLARLDLERYLALPHCVVRFDSQFPTMIEQAWAREGLDPRAGVIARGFVEALFLLPGTPMIATTQRRLAHKLARSLPLQTFHSPVVIGALEQEMSWHGRQDADPAHRFMREQWAAAAEQLADVIPF